MCYYNGVWKNCVTITVFGKTMCYYNGVWKNYGFV